MRRLPILLATLALLALPSTAHAIRDEVGGTMMMPQGIPIDWRWEFSARRHEAVVRLCSAPATKNHNGSGPLEWDTAWDCKRFPRTKAGDLKIGRVFGMSATGKTQFHPRPFEPGPWYDYRTSGYITTSSFSRLVWHGPQGTFKLQRVFKRSAAARRYGLRFWLLRFIVPEADGTAERITADRKSGKRRKRITLCRQGACG